MNRRTAINNARRIKSATARVEHQPYDYVPRVRTPRLGSPPVFLCCQLSATLNAATGSWPALTAGSLANQQVYVPATNGSLQAISATNSTILNYYSSAFNASKTTYVVPSGQNAFVVVTQDC